MRGQRPDIRLPAELLEHAGRALDVGEEEGDRAYGKLARLQSCWSVRRDGRNCQAVECQALDIHSESTRHSSLRSSPEREPTSARRFCSLALVKLCGNYTPPEAATILGLDLDSWQHEPPSAMRKMSMPSRAEFTSSPTRSRVLVTCPLMAQNRNKILAPRHTQRTATDSRILKRLGNRAIPATVYMCRAEPAANREAPLGHKTSNTAQRAPEGAG